MIFLLLGIVVAPVTVLMWRPFNAWLARLLNRGHYGWHHFLSDWFWTALIQAAIWHFGSHHAALAAGALISAAVAGLAWWYRRKRRRGATRLGAKSRALRERLVRVMRRERRPSRVLRPHPVPS